MNSLLSPVIERFLCEPARLNAQLPAALVRRTECHNDTVLNEVDNDGRKSKVSCHVEKLINITVAYIKRSEFRNV